MSIDRSILPVVEALIFAAEQPMTVDRISKILEITNNEAWDAVDLLAKYYSNETRGIELAEAGGAFFFKTKPLFSKWIKKIVAGKEVSLSRAAMEVMSIIAYKQPVTHAEITQVRGVDSANPLRMLLDKKLIRIAGKKDVPGKPHVYATTRDFLRAFGLSDLTQLPSIREIREMHQDKQLKLLNDDMIEPLVGTSEETEQGFRPMDDSSFTGTEYDAETEDDDADADASSQGDAPDEEHRQEGEDEDTHSKDNS